MKRKKSASRGSDWDGLVRRVRRKGPHAVRQRRRAPGQARRPSGTCPPPRYDGLLMRDVPSGLLDGMPRSGRGVGAMPASGPPVAPLSRRRAFRPSSPCRPVAQAACSPPPPGHRSPSATASSSPSTSLVHRVRRPGRRARLSTRPPAPMWRTWCGQAVPVLRTERVVDRGRDPSRRSRSVSCVVLTALERRIGGLRTAGVFLLGHVLATLATEVPVGLAVLVGHLPATSLHRLDYGVSFGRGRRGGRPGRTARAPWLRWPLLGVRRDADAESAGVHGPDDRLGAPDGVRDRHRAAGRWCARWYRARLAYEPLARGRRRAAEPRPNSRASAGAGSWRRACGLLLGQGGDHVAEARTSAVRRGDRVDQAWVIRRRIRAGRGSRAPCSAAGRKIRPSAGPRAARPARRDHPGGDDFRARSSTCDVQATVRRGPRAGRASSASQPVTVVATGCRPAIRRMASAVTRRSARSAGRLS